VIVSSKAHAIKQTLIDYDVEVIPVPKAPIHLGIRSELLSIVSDVYAQASRKYTAAPNPEIVSLVNAVTPGDLRAFVTYLTGEDPSSNILTRNSISPGAKDAAEWIQKQFQTFGLAATSSAFRTDYSPNVIGILPGVTDPTKIVVVGGHYDSRGPTSTSATQRAPGANDNGSGTGAVITMAKVIHELNATFDYTIHFLAYSGEEQGLYGSAAYATKLQTEKASVIGVLNADMVAYRVPTEKTQCAFPSRYSTPALETLAREAVATYVPELTIGITTACCSDHQSYYNRGFPATGFF
jgi:acetylornithine deacetylase/succinyl-diaminopimelate desuccinylase-like protein